MALLPRADPSPASKIALSLLALLVATVGCEIAARLMFPRPPDDTRQPQIVYRYDPEVGYVLAPNQQGWSNDGFVTVNSLGFRGGEVTIPKPSGRFRIVLIGDSVAAGLGVADDETFAARVENLLRKHVSDQSVDVVNLAVSGYNTRQEVALLKRHAARLDPDLVLVGFYVNDIEGSLDDERETFQAGGTRILAANPQPGQILHMEASGGSWWNRELRRSRAAYLVGRVVTRVTHRGEWASARFALEQTMLQDGDSPDIERGWSNVERAMKDLKTLAESHFGVGIVSLPCKEQVVGSYPASRYAHRLREISERLGFFVIDPIPALRAQQGETDLFIPYDRNHENALGHQIIAETIFYDLMARHALSTSDPSPSRPRS